MQKIKIKFEYAYNCDYMLGGVDDEDVYQEYENGEQTVEEIISDGNYVTGIEGFGMVENTAKNIKVFIDDKQVEEFSTFEFPSYGWSVYVPQDETILMGVVEKIDEKNAEFSFKFELPENEKFSIDRVFMLGISLDEVRGGDSVIVDTMLYLSNELITRYIEENYDDLKSEYSEFEELFKNKEDNWDKIVKIFLDYANEYYEVITEYVVSYDENSNSWNLGDDFEDLDDYLISIDCDKDGNEVDRRLYSI